MEIKKSYELRQVGPKIVLLMMHAPDYQFKVLLKADKLLSSFDGNDIPQKLGTGQFFVLQTGRTYALCWERHDTLEFIEGCADFKIFEDTLLFCKAGCWYWWNASVSAEEKHPLGTDLNLFHQAFIQADKNAYLLMYFEDGTNLKCKRCLSYEVLDSNLLTHTFLSHELYSDVLKIVTADEGTLYVSIEKEKGPSYRHMHGTTEGRVTYRFLFNKEPASELIAFEKFVNKTCEAFMKKGFSIATSLPGVIVTGFDERITGSSEEAPEESSVEPSEESSVEASVEPSEELSVSSVIGTRLILIGMVLVLSR